MTVCAYILTGRLQERALVRARNSDLDRLLHVLHLLLDGLLHILHLGLLLNVLDLGLLLNILNLGLRGGNRHHLTHRLCLGSEHRG